MSVRERNLWLMAVLMLVVLAGGLTAHFVQGQLAMSEAQHRRHQAVMSWMERWMTDELLGMQRQLSRQVNAHTPGTGDLDLNALKEDNPWLEQVLQVDGHLDAPVAEREAIKQLRERPKLASGELAGFQLGLVTPRSPRLLAWLPLKLQAGSASTGAVLALRTQTLNQHLAHLSEGEPLEVQVHDHLSGLRLVLQTGNLPDADAKTTPADWTGGLVDAAQLSYEGKGLHEGQAQWWRDLASDFGLFVLLAAALLMGVHTHIRGERRRHAERELAQLELQQRQDKQRLATEAARIGVWELDTHSLKLEWDATLYKLYGLPADSLNLSLSDWLACISPKDRDRVQQGLKSPPPNTLNLVCLIFKPGEAAPRVMRIQGRLGMDKHTGKPRWLGTQQDITEQREAESLLKQTENKFRTAFELAPVGTAIYNLEGRFIQVNQALCHMLGYSPAELLCASLESLIHPQDLVVDKAPYQALLQGERQSYQVEKRIIDSKGHVVWTTMSVSAVRDDTQGVQHLIAQVQNITERKKSEAALIEREHFLRTLSECLPGLVSYWGKDLRCHFANKNYELWTGVPMAQLRGMHLRRLLGDTLFNLDKPHVAQVLHGEPQRFERRKRKPNGEFADTLVHLIPDVLYGQVEGFFALSTDITELKTQQRELEHMNNQLVVRTEQAESASRAKSAFLANMSHEIRTPMNAIMGLLQLMGDTALNAEQHSYLRKIGSAADVLLNVLNDVLDLSRVEANKLELDMQRFRLDDLLNKTVDLFSYRAEEKQIELVCTKAPGTPVSVVGDRLRVAQVLNNLVSNALKFTEQGRIEVELRPAAKPTHLEFVVRDSGSGMSQTQVDLLFKPFSQVDSSATRRHGGAGLGLSICKNLCELMGGDVWVQSKPGQGSTFGFSIQCNEPLFEAECNEPLRLTGGADTALPTLDESTAHALDGLRVLVVDDHKLNRLVASEMIRKSGGLVTLAEDGQQAIEACKASVFDVVLMDLQMPVVDGFEATATILNMLGDAAPPIVAVTASATEKDRQAILEAGMREHLIKPFQKERLVGILSELKTPLM